MQKSLSRINAHIEELRDVILKLESLEITTKEELSAFLEAVKPTFSFSQDKTLDVIGYVSVDEDDDRFKELYWTNDGVFIQGYWEKGMEEFKPEKLDIDPFDEGWRFDDLRDMITSTLSDFVMLELEAKIRPLNKAVEVMKKYEDAENERLYKQRYEEIRNKQSTEG